MANFEDGERSHEPKDGGHPLEGTKEQESGNGPSPT